MKHPRLPRRPARHGDHLRRGAAQRARDRRARTSPRCASCSPAPAPRPSARPSTTCASACKREHILMCDRAGRDLRRAAGGRHGSVQGALRPRRPSARTIADALVGADVFVGLSVAGAVTRRDGGADGERARSSSRSPTPSRRSLPEEVRAVRDDAIIATGRSDYPNQVNNVLGFPFIFRGALDVRATEINEEMKMAATRALAPLAKQDVPDSVAALYGLRNVQFGPEYLIPFPFDPRVLLWVAPGGGVGGGGERRGARVHRPRRVPRAARGAARPGARHHARPHQPRRSATRKRIVFPEGEEPKIIRAARILRRRRHRAARSCSATARRSSSIAEQHRDLRSTRSRSRTRPRRRAARTYAHYLWERRQRKGLIARRGAPAAVQRQLLRVVHGGARRRRRAASPA